VIDDQPQAHYNNPATQPTNRCQRRQHRAAPPL